MTANRCDNTSVGVIIQEIDGRILLIKRTNYPEAIALPAGHLDSDSFENGLLREVEEEVGIFVDRYSLMLNDRFDNPCKRENGGFHHWKVFRANAWHGEMKAGSDAKEAFWASRKQLQKYSARLEYFMKKYQVSACDIGKLTRAIFGDPVFRSTDPEWKENPGLEPVWYYIFKELGIL